MLFEIQITIYWIISWIDDKGTQEKEQQKPRDPKPREIENKTADEIVDVVPEIASQIKCKRGKFFRFTQNLFH